MSGTNDDNANQLTKSPVLKEKDVVTKTKQPPASQRLTDLLVYYSKYLSSSANQDKLLKLLQYTLWLASVAVSSRIYQQQQKQQQQQNSNNSTKKNDYAGALFKVSAEISMARYVTRLLGLPTALEALRTGSWTSSSKNYNTLFRWIGRILASSMVLYYPMEHMAYVQWTVMPNFIQPKHQRSAEWWSYWSCRMWALYNGAELIQGLLQLQEYNQELQQQQQQQQQQQESNDESKKESICKSFSNTKLQVYRNLLFLLPTLHWSLPNWDRKPWLSTPLLNTLMWLEAVVCVYQSVQNK